jgi:two-component system sensor histidine kinase MprB
MTLKARIAVIAAVAVAVAVVLTSIGIYVTTSRTLLSGVDHSLRETATELARVPRDGLGPLVGPRIGRFGGPAVYVQAVTADGQIVAAPDDVTLPYDDATIAVATGARPAFFDTVEVDGQALRVLTVPTRTAVAVQIARPLGETQDALATLRRQLLLVGLVGVGVAAALGLVVATRAVRPVDELTEVAEDVAATQDLTRRITVRGDDEIGRLARTFNGMLEAIEQARRAQEQLVADASHELRTPLTSLRTNIEVLAQVDRLSPDQRQALIDDVVVQLDEFGRLIGALVELARGEQPARGAVPVRLDDLVTRVVERARTFAPNDQRIDLDVQPSTVRVEADRVERAVSNLVDNALKYGEGQPVEVAVRDGTVTVRDHGPGVPDEHLAHVFDRFYRAPEARGAPGSGLGLSIVQQVAASHGGTVEVANGPGGGAVFSLRLPTADPAEGDPPPPPPPPAARADGTGRAAPST